MYRIIWAYAVKPATEAEFARIYCRDGEWAQLFRKAEGYEGTSLLRDMDEAGRYVTIDRWRSRDDFEQFRETFKGEYRALDARCDALTDREQMVGDFET